MEISFRQRIKDYFSFMKNDRNGILVLMVLINLTIAGHFLVDNIEIKPHYDLIPMVEEFEAWEEEKQNEAKSLSFFHFDPNTVSESKLDSLNLPAFIKNNIIRYRKAGGKFYEASDLQKIYGMNDSIFTRIKPWLLFPEMELVKRSQIEIASDNFNKGAFDPNSAGADELSRFGFNKFQVSNIEKYRDKGGQFYTPEDVMKIYGVDSAVFLSVKDYIQIKETYNEISQKSVVVEINQADSLELVNLRGIGPVFAARIIKYRNLLGGFVSLNQLLEVYGFPEDTFVKLKGNLVVDTTGVKKIRLNFAEYRELVRHPYLEKKHVVNILNYRDNQGAFISVQELIRYELVDSVSFQKIKPYLTCR